MNKDRTSTSTSIATVGAFARVAPETANEVRRKLASIEGVTLFDLDELSKVGLVIETLGLDAAHKKVTQEIKYIDGVLGVWPLYADFDDN